MISYAAAVLLLALNSMPVPVVAATPAERAEARRLSETIRQLDDPVRRQARAREEERWQLEHEKRMAGHKLQQDLIRAESEKLDKEREQRLVAAADRAEIQKLKKKQDQRLVAAAERSDLGMTVWILFISIAVALLLVAGSAIATRRAAKGTAQR